MDHEHFRRMHGRGGKMPRISHEVALRGKTQVADQTWLFTFERPPALTYRAGQHVRMSLIKPRYRDDQGESRFLSFVSAPSEPDLAFALRMRDSAFKRSLAALPIGGKVKIEMLATPPPGAFGLPDNDPGPMVFIAGGIGVVPARAMIVEALAKGFRSTLVLIYVNRRRDDAPFLGELEALAAHHPNFTFVPTLTQPYVLADALADDAWAGERGHVSDAMIRRHVSDERSAIYFVAGLPGMVGATKALLATMAIAPDAVHAEEFGGFTAAHAPRRRLGLLPVLGIALVVIVALAAHLAPLWLITGSRPLDWLNHHLISLGAGLIVLAILVVKAGIVLLARRKGRRLH